MSQGFTRRLATVLAAVSTGALGCAASAHAAPDGEILVMTCVTLDEYPNMRGIVGIIDILTSNGYTGYQAGRTIWRAVQSVCPEHTELVQRFAYAVT